MKTTDYNKILVIDDDIDIGSMLKTILEHKGYNVIFLENPVKIKETIKKNDIDLVILDMLLSGVNGTEICIELKNDPLVTNTPVMMISAHPDAEQICIAAGADEFIAKPFDLQYMFSKINKLFSQNNLL